MKKLIAGFTLLSCYGAFAQTDTAKQKTLDEVIVTANKFAQKQSATGKVLTVIDRTELERNTGRTLTQVLNEQAGLTISGSQNAPGTNQTVYMQGASAAYTLILVDGMPVNDASGISAEFDLNHFSIEQIERVEILKGTQSVLYGSDAVAGVINIITKKTGTKPLAANGTIAGGTYGTFKTNVGVSGKINWFSYNAQYNHLQSRGFSAATDTTGKQNFDNDGFNQNNISATLDAAITKNWKVKLFGLLDHYYAGIDDGGFADDKNNSIKNINKQLALNSVYIFKNGSLTVNANENNISRNQTDLANDPPGLNDYDPYFGLYKGNSIFAEAFTNINLHKYFSVVAGVDYRNQKASSEDSSAYGKSVNDSMKSGMYSVYASLLLKSFKGLNAEFGGRYTYHSSAGSNFSYSVNPSYLINEKVKLFANLSTGFRAPSLYNIVYKDGNSELKPEKSTSFEGGVQYFNQSKTANFRANYFHRIIKDIILYNANYRYTNGDKQNDQGVELEATVNPISKLNITANYTYVDGKLTRHQTNGKDTSYYNLSRRPRNAVNVHAGYQFTNSLYISTSFRWQDKRQDLFYNSSTYLTEIVELAGYYNLDAYAEYKIALSKGNRFVKIFGDFRNITNQTYFDWYGYNTRKFNFMAGVMVGL